MFKGADGKMVGLKNVLWVPNLAANLISVRRLQKAGTDTSSKGAKTYTARLGEWILWDLHEDRDVYNEMWQIPVVTMPKERQVAASISTEGEAVGSGDITNGRAKEIESKKCNLGGTSKLGEHEESGAAAKEQHKGEENPKAVAEEEYGESMWGTIASVAFSNPTSATGELKDEMVAGIRVKGEPDEVLGCPTCMQAKFTRYPFSSSEATAKAPLDEVVMDVVGPLKLGAVGAEYFLTIVDVYTRMTWVYVLSKKSDVAETVKTDWLPMVEWQQDRLLKKNGIRHFLTMPYSPAMNSITERANWTITATARGLLIEAGLPDYFWPDAVRSACVAKNRALTHVGADKWVPYVEWVGRKPKVDMLRVFGCVDCKFMENLMYKDWKAENEAKIGMRFGEVKSSGLEHVELPLELSSSSTTTRQSSLVNGGEEAKDAEEEEEEVQQVSERAPTLPSRTTSAPRIRVTPQQRQGLHVPAAEEEGRGKRRIQAPNRLTYDALGKPAKSFSASASNSLAIAHSSVYQPLALSSTFGRVRRAEWSVPRACGLPHVSDDVHTTSSRVPSQPPGSLRGSWQAPKGALGWCEEGTAFLVQYVGHGALAWTQGPVIFTGHADASWVDDSATQRSSQGYSFSLGCGSVSSRSTRSSSVLSSSCEAEIYAGAMAAQELCWLTYLLTHLGEQPRLPPILFVDNKARIALYQEHRLEHRTKHIALHYFLTRELQQRGHLRLAYVATRANIADIFTKAFPPGYDNCTVCALYITLHVNWPCGSLLVLGLCGDFVIHPERALVFLTGLSVLHIADPRCPFELVTDASDIAVGEVLLQDFGNGLQPIGYESRKLHPPKCNYPLRDREMMAIVRAFEVWRCYLTKADVTVPLPPLPPQLICPRPLGPLTATAATAAPAYCATMASLRVLASNHEGRPVRFDMWLDDLQLYLLSDIKDGVSLFDHVSGAATAPPTTADNATRSQWLTRDAPARLAIRNHLPLAECAHFGKHRTAQALYDAVVAHYSSPATAAQGRLLLLYLFLELSAFATVEDLVSQLCASVARYHAAVPAEFVDKNQPPMDNFLSLDPTSLIVDLLEQHLLAAETSAVAVGAARGTPRPPFFEGCSPSPLAPSYASAAAAADVSVAEDIGAAFATAKRRSGKGKGGKGGGGGSGGGGGGSGSSGGGSSGGGGGGGTGGGSGGFGGGGGGSGGSGGGGGSGTGGGGTGARRVGFGGGQRQQHCPYVIRTGDHTSQTCGRLHTQHRCFSSLDDAWRAEFGDDVELPRWADLLRSRIAIFDLDFDAILSAMYALSVSAEGDCYRCVPSDSGLAATALGASESGTLPGTAPAQALHTFTLDSGASASFIRESTTLTPLSTPVLVRLADPSGDPVVACSSTVLLCPAVSSGSLSSLYLPSFSTNLVSTAALQDAMVTTTTPKGQSVTICTCTRMGRHLATFTRRPGSSLYTIATEPPQVAASAQVSASGQVAASCSCRLLSHQTLLWHHRPGHPSLPCLCGMHSRLLHAAPHSSSFPSTTAPLQTLHMDVWSPAQVSGQSHERYFLLVVDDYTRYTTVFPLHSKGQVVDVLIPWIRTVRLQLREHFGQDLPVLRLHSDRGGEFSSNLLWDVCRGEGRLPSEKLDFSAPHSLSHGGRSYLDDPCGCSPFSVAVCGPVWGSRAFVRDTFANKLPPRAIPCIFLGFVPDAPGWQFYHPTSRRVFPSQDVTFDESVPFYRLFPYCSAPPPPLPLFLAPGPPPAPGSCSLRGAEPGGKESEGAETWGAEPEGVEPGGGERWGAEPEGVEPGGAEPGGVEPGGAVLEGVWSGGAEPQGDASGATRPGGAGAAGAGGTGVAAGAGVPRGTATTGPGGACTRGTGAAGTSGVEGSGARDPTESGATKAGGYGAGDAGAGGTGAGGLELEALVLEVLELEELELLTPVALCGRDHTSFPCFTRFLPASPLPAPSPYTKQSGGLTERSDPTSRPVSPDRTASRVPRSRPPPVPCTHAMTLRPSSIPLRVPQLAPPESSLPEDPDPVSDCARAASPTVSRLLTTTVTDPSFESAAASALVFELLDFAAVCHLDYTSALVAEYASSSPPSVGGECAFQGEATAGFFASPKACYVARGFSQQ
ncbi:unnamed protein product [Closterium sp. NIES-54]